MNKNWLFWTPRILAILFIIFLSLFSLDVFDGNYGFWGTILGLFMHNIHSIILLIVLIVAWKHEIVGAICFFLAGIFYYSTIIFNLIGEEFKWYMIFYPLIIAGPAFLIAILFFINSRKKKH